MTTLAPERVGAVQWLTLPDGTDTTDPAVRARVSAFISQRDPEGRLVPMWPRYPDVEDGVAVRLPLVDSRPGARTIALGPGAAPSAALRVAAVGERQRLGAMIDFDPYRGTATFAQLDGPTLAIRTRLAELLKCQPHEIVVACFSVVDPETAESRLDQVVVLRTPTVSISAEKRIAAWNELVKTLPGGSSGWEVLDEPATGEVRLRFGKPRVLPSSVTYEQVALEPVIRRERWNLLHLGLNPEGQLVKIDLKAGPHIGVGGATSSGKSTAIRAMLTSALLHGHDIAVIDPVKKAGDFRAFEDYAVAWCDDTREQAAEVMAAITAEGARRQEVLVALGLPDIWEMSQAERDEHRIKPLFVVFDEFQVATMAKKVPAGIPRDDPLVKRAQQFNLAIARITDDAQSGVLELRNKGIHFCFAGQVVSAEAFGSALRANLSSVVYTVPKIGGLLPKREILQGQFGASVDEALTLAAALRTREPGLALTMAEDGTVEGVRVAFGRPEEIGALLEAAGVPKTAQRLAVPDVAAEAAEPEFGSVITPVEPFAAVVEPVAEAVVDLGDFELDWNLYDLAEPDPGPIEPPAPLMEQGPEPPELFDE